MQSFRDPGSFYLMAPLLSSRLSEFSMGSLHPPGGIETVDDDMRGFHGRF